MKSNTYEVLIVGGGTAGITVASELALKKAFSSIAVIEPSSVHYYQPLWTLVGGGVFPKEESRKKEHEVIPNGVEWIQDAVTDFIPQENTVLTAKKNMYRYKYLVVAPGMEIYWDRIKGLKKGLETDWVCSNYSYKTVDKTWKCIQNLEEGNALFTFPNTPVKCAGAPQKIMYLADDYFRLHGKRKSCEVWFVSAGQAIFAVKKYADALRKVIDRKKIQELYKHNLVEIDAEKKIAVFENIETKQTFPMAYGMIHVAPPMGSPGFIKRSPLANADGWIDVDKFTLQHTKFPNVFGLGDASSLPTSRTGAAVRKEAPILIHNLLAHRHGKTLDAKYDGYTSCPLVTGYGKLILAEFDYDGKPKETFPFDQSKERRSMYLLKKYLLPILYWQGMLKGRA